jgi:hypothetical protein
VREYQDSYLRECIGGKQALKLSLRIYSPLLLFLQDYVADRNQEQGHGRDADVTLRRDPRNEVVDVAFPGGRRPGERELATTPLFYRSSASGVRGKQGVCTMSKGIELM